MGVRRSLEINFWKAVSAVGAVNCFLCVFVCFCVLLCVSA